MLKVTDVFRFLGHPIGDGLFQAFKVFMEKPLLLENHDALWICGRK